MIRRPPKSPLFPYPTLSRSRLVDEQAQQPPAVRRLHVDQLVSQPGHRRLHHRSEEHTSELQSRPHLVCRLLLEKKKKKQYILDNDLYTGTIQEIYITCRNNA